MSFSGVNSSKQQTATHQQGNQRDPASRSNPQWPPPHRRINHIANRNIRRRAATMANPPPHSAWSLGVRGSQLVGRNRSPEVEGVTSATGVPHLVRRVAARRREAGTSSVVYTSCAVSDDRALSSAHLTYGRGERHPDQEKGRSVAVGAAASAQGRSPPLYRAGSFPAQPSTLEDDIYNAVITARIQGATIVAVCACARRGCGGSSAAWSHVVIARGRRIGAIFRDDELSCCDVRAIVTEHL